MSDNRNFILAIVLSLAVLLGWSAISRQFFPTAAEPSTKVENGKQVPQQQPSQQPTGTVTTPQTNRALNLVLRESPRLAIETPSLRGSINLKGARIDDLVLTRHTQTIAADSPPVRLFSPAGTEGSYFATLGWQGQNVRLPDANAVWQPSGPRLAPNSPVTLSWDNGQGQVFQIVLTVDDNYLFATEQRVMNRGGGPVSVRPFSTLSRVGESHDPDIWTMHVGPVGVFDGKADYDNNYADVATDGQRQFTSTGGWLGFSDKYWLAAIIPGQDAQIGAALRHNAPTNSFQADVTSPAAIVAPGQVTSTRSHIFAGAKEVGVLETYGDTLGTNIDKAVDWGWYEWFMRPIFSLLLWLFHTLGNFGFAIIGLTLIVRLLMYPIAQKQFRSMGAMRAIQPKVQQLQERYKDDKQRQQQEMLKLYKEEKVNPAAGCLPVLIQIPIFYALYRVLTVAVEMRHQPWIGWIHDLSAPDPATPVNLFGYLPFDPPGLLHIGVLPILVGVTMWMQQKLNPPIPDPIQRRIFGYMPWFLMFVMAPFAAGLQLYWVTNNILSIAQQRLLYARHPEMRHAPTTPAPKPAPSGDAPVDKPRGSRRKPRAR